MDTKTFEREMLTLSLCPLCIPTANTFKLETSNNPEFYFFPIPKGTYALIGMQHSTYRYSNYCRGSFAFKIEAGQINFVDMTNGTFPRKGALERLQKIISLYPDITAEASLANIPAVISFDHVGSTGNACDFTNPFTVTSPENFRTLHNQIQ